MKEHHSSPNGCKKSCPICYPKNLKRKVYRVWAVIEEYDPNTDTYRDLTEHDLKGATYMLSRELTSKKQAMQHAQSLDVDQGTLK